MAKLVAVSDPDTALGFRLAGIEVAEAAGAKDAAERLLRLHRTKEAGVVIYNEEYRAGLSEQQQAVLDESIEPVFFAVPVARARRTAEAGDRVPVEDQEIGALFVKR